MKILGIDPGTEQTGWVYTTQSHSVSEKGITENNAMLI